MAGVPAEDRWLTAILRPAGALDDGALDRLCVALGHLAAGSDMVVVDLTATVVSGPCAFARKLRTSAREFGQPGRCLLLVGASAGLAAELERHAVPVVTLAADVLPHQARFAPSAPASAAGLTA